MHPTLFKIGSLEVRAWGTMLIVAAVVFGLWMLREVKQRGLDPALVIDFVLWALVGGVIGARIGHVLLDWPAYRADPAAAFKIWTGGLSFHGGLAGGIIAAAALARARKMPVLELFDIATPGLPLGYALARVGCFLSGCCRGVVASESWPLKFRFAVDPQMPWRLTEPSHPAQLYSSVASLAVFGIILLLKPTLRRRGQLFFSYLVLYSFVRFWMEFIRAPDTKIALGHFPLSLAQVGSILLAVAAGVVVVLMERKRVADAAAAAEPPVEEPEDQPQTTRRRRAHR